MRACKACGRTFTDHAAYELHVESCADVTLVCRSCGSKFEEASATEDGWHYRCPEQDCDGEGLGDGLKRVGESLLVKQ